MIFQRVEATKRTERRVENNRAHFGALSPVSVKGKFLVLTRSCNLLISAVTSSFAASILMLTKLRVLTFLVSDELLTELVSGLTGAVPVYFRFLGAVLAASSSTGITSGSPWVIKPVIGSKLPEPNSDSLSGSLYR